MSGLGGLDAASLKVLKESRDRIILLLAEAYQEAESRSEFKEKAEELIDFHHSETREICIKVKNLRTKEAQVQRVDVRGIVPSAENLTQVMRWGAWLYARGWDTTDFDSAVRITRASHPYPVAMVK